MPKPRVDLDAHTITYKTCGNQQNLPDLARTSAMSVQACVDIVCARWHPGEPIDGWREMAATEQPQAEPPKAEPPKAEPQEEFTIPASA